MRHRQLITVILIAITTIGLTIFYYALKAHHTNVHITIHLPKPMLTSNTSVEQALAARRSIRQFTNQPITLQQIAQLMWAAQGITSPNGFRTAPSAGALYPLEVYVVAKQVSGMEMGVYHYLPATHTLEQLSTADKMNDLYLASGKQTPLQQCAAAIVITGEYTRTTKKYGPRGMRYVQLEAGHAAQNIELEAVSVHLGAVTMGGFSDDMVIDTLAIPATQTPLYIIPIGNKMPPT